MLAKNESIIPVHPEDSILYYWACHGRVVNTFGLRSAPNIFNAITNRLTWVLQHNGVSLEIHYLDIFLFLGPPQSNVCKQALTANL